MKLTSILAVIALSLSAFASQTRVEHDYAAVLQGIALNNACLTDSEVKSINPVRTCAKLEKVVTGSGDYEEINWVCTAWETRQVVNSRAYTESVCTEYEKLPDGMTFCKTTSRVSRVLPATIMVRVITEGSEYSNWPGVEQSFTFPACK